MVGAIGKRVLSVDLVPTSRAEADRAMRVLLGQDTGYDVAQLDDIRAHANLLELLDVLRERPHLQEGRLEPLITGDNQRGRVLLETLRAYLDHFGDVTQASRALQVHPNTFRYRLGRIAKVTGLRLDDPAERIMTTLQPQLIT